MGRFAFIMMVWLEPSLAAAACEWWQAPVIIGGTGGSGTRGVVKHAQSRGVFILGTDKQACVPNIAMDTNCVEGCKVAGIPNSLTTYVDGTLVGGVNDPPNDMEEAAATCRDPDRAIRALRRIPQSNRKKWAWGWKHPKTMYRVAELRSVFPCLHYVHVMRDPRDMAAVPHEHIQYRAGEIIDVAKAQGCAPKNCTSPALAATCLCGNDSVCASTMARLPSFGELKMITGPVKLEAFEKKLPSESVRPTRLALQCMHLLLWANVNKAFANWALHDGGLAQTGEYLRWQSEIMIDPDSRRGMNLTAAFETETLRRPRPSQKQRRAEERGRRRLGYGKWREIIPEHDFTILDHCGPWRDVMIDLFECGNDDQLPPCNHLASEPNELVAGETETTPEETRAAAHALHRAANDRVLPTQPSYHGACAEEDECADMYAPPPVVTSSRPNDDRPNIVVIVADDMGWNETKQMPFVTAVRGMLGTLSLARQYVLWSCAPTRSSLLTGRHAGRWGAGGLGPKPWVDVGVPLREAMLQQHLQGLGYVTAHIGKWHLGHGHRDYLPSNRGFSHSFGHLNGAIHYYTKVPAGIPYSAHSEVAPDWQRDGVDVGTDVNSRYSTHIITEDAVEFLREGHDHLPFFLYVAYNAVHGPIGSVEHPSNEGHPKYRPHEDVNSSCNVKNRAFVEMDNGIRQLWDALHATEDTNNTLVLFLSDNGAVNECGGANFPLRGGKKSLWDGGLRVPAWVHFPRVIHRSAEVTCPVHVTDWLPTFIGLAGGQLDPSVAYDGHDLLPLLQGENCNAHRVFGHREIVLQLLHGGVGALMRVFKLETTTCWNQKGGTQRTCTNVSAFKIVKTKPSEIPQIFEVYTDPREKTNVRKKPGKIPWFNSLTDRDKRAVSGLLSELDARLAAKHSDIFSTYLEPIMMSDDATDFASGSTHPPAGWSPPSGTWVPVSFKCPQPAGGGRVAPGSDEDQTSNPQLRVARLPGSG